MKSITKVVLSVAASIVLAIPCASDLSAQAPAATPTSPTSGKKAAATPAPTSQEIADAKAKGMVWVNTSTHVYHKDGASYGATKHGKFMTENDATKAGYRAAKEPGGKEAMAAPAPSK